VSAETAPLCTHELWERETFVADGMCPFCLQQRIERLAAAVAGLAKERGAALQFIREIGAGLHTYGDVDRWLDEHMMEQP
jgi:hypothetical protein